MPLIDGPDGAIEVQLTGRGTPVTVFAHGLGACIDETRPFGSGVRGSRVFFHFRGHGATVGWESPWTYAALAAELQTVAAAYGARRALGVSLGAGALLRAAADTPAAFDRLVFVLPAAIDRPRVDAAVKRMQRQAEMVQRGDLDALAASLLGEQPPAVRDRADVQVWARRQASRLSAPTVARALRELSLQHPVESRSVLARVRCPALVVGQEGDAAHPASIARKLAGALPTAELAMFDASGLAWNHRVELRAVISRFFDS